MSVKIKVTVDPTNPKPKGYIYRPETFFLTVSNRTYEGLVAIALEDKTTLNDTLVKIIKEACDNVECNGTI